MTDDEAFSWLEDDQPPAGPAADDDAVPPVETETQGPGLRDGHRGVPVPPRAAPGADTLPPASPIEEPDGQAQVAGSDAGGPTETAGELRARIQQLQRKLHDLEPSADAQPAAPAPAPLAGEGQPRVQHSLLGSQVFTRHLRQFGNRRRTEPVDEFGLDPTYESRFKRVLDFLHSTYFRIEVEGLEHVPEKGRCLIVANHSGGPIPYDGLMLRAAMKREHPAARELRWLSEDFIHHLPFVGTMMSRLGAVRACQQNAERLLSAGLLVAVFPEGAKGIGRLFRNRYRLRRFGRGGYVRLCIRTQTPLVPCALVGPEEANPTLFKLETVARYLGVPHLPITPTFPLLGPIGLLPAPTKWKLRFGDVVHFDDHPPEAADDEVLVGRLSDRIRANIQTMLDTTIAKRRSVFFG